MIKRLSLVLSVFAVGCTAATAADLPARTTYTKAPPPLIEPVASWTGFYIGANGGYGWKDSTASIAPGDPATSFVTGSGHQIVDPASTSLNTSGGLGGVQIGYNWQFDRTWVAGFEADFDGADIR